MKRQIEKFLIKVELNSDSYITGEFLCRNQHQIHLLNSMYTNGDKIVLPNVTLNIRDVKSIVQLNEGECTNYISIVKSKNMLYPSEKCSKCASPKEEPSDVYSGIKPIEEGFDSNCEESTVESELELGEVEDLEVKIRETSSEDSSSSISESEDFKEAFKKSLASRNIAVSFKDDNVEADRKKPLAVNNPVSDNKQKSSSVTPKDIQNIQNDLKNLHIAHQQGRIQRNVPKTNPTDHPSRRKEQPPKMDKESFKKKSFQRPSQPLPKGRIVLAWKQKKYKDGFEVLESISSKFTKSFGILNGWTNLTSTYSLDEIGRKLYHDGLNKEKK